MLTAPKHRQRANSDENILVQADDNNSMLNQHGGRRSAEPLSQFVMHNHNSLGDLNDDTESENSMDAEVNDQLKQEQQPAKTKEDIDIEAVTNVMQPIKISTYRQYLEWFAQHELARIQPSQVKFSEKTMNLS